MRLEMLFGCFIWLALATPSLSQTTAPMRTDQQPTNTPLCFYQGQSYSIGAGFCMSSQLWQTCVAPDQGHQFPFWWTANKPECSGVVTAPPPQKQKGVAP
jgi:hypothetical protein